MKYLIKVTKFTLSTGVNDDGVVFYFSLHIKSYQDDEGVIMKSSVQ